MVQEPGVNVIKTFCLLFKIWLNKLECSGMSNHCEFGWGKLLPTSQ
jgi:hypothetical protein